MKNSSDTVQWQNLPKYSFNAKELDEETGMYYYEARYYAPPVFTSRDAMMDQKPWLTPYHYCSNNPVGRVDPSGMMDDEWEFDRKGKCLNGDNPIENNNKDIIRIVKTDRHGNIKMDKNGNKKVIAEESFDKGTIIKAGDTTMGGKFDFDEFDATVINIDEKFEKNRIPIFEFLSQNTYVEWGTLLGEDKNGDYLGIVATSQDAKKELVSTFYLESMAFQQYKKISECYHSHTRNAIGTPSGYSHMNGREPYGSGDHGVAIRYSYYSTTLKVFDSSSGRYYHYYKGGYK